MSHQQGNKKQPKTHKHNRVIKTTLHLSRIYAQHNPTRYQIYMCYITLVSVLKLVDQVYPLVTLDFFNNFVTLLISHLEFLIICLLVWWCCSDQSQPTVIGFLEKVKGWISSQRRTCLNENRVRREELWFKIKKECI